MKLKKYWKEACSNKNTYCSKCGYKIKKGQMIKTFYENGKLVSINCTGCYVGWEKFVNLPKEWTT